jgi:hypothetical protein
MESAMNWVIRLLFAAAAVGAVATLPAVADDFHVDNKMYYKPHDKRTRPVETTTLFAAGRVYDFMQAPDETIVFDPSQDLIVLLDPNRHMMTQISTGEVSTEISKLREAAQNHKSEAVREAAAAKFSESVDPKTGVLKLTNRWMKYEVETMAPSQPQVARQYAEFADWMAQLNAILNPPTPPFPRLALNRVLRQRQELPEKITLTITPEEKSPLTWRKEKELVIKSEHTILMALAKEDRERIEEAGRQMHMFQRVSFDEYHRIQGQAQAAAEAALK